ncbi:hypothetical protein K0U07_00795 [bacterium]|nr:hypothetical protein [bacterium]
MSDVLSLSKDMQEQAKRLLEGKGLLSLFSSFGEVLFAGSFAMDLMIWKDIDLNIVVDSEKIEEVTKDLVMQLLDNSAVQRIKVYRDLHDKYAGKMPKGIYVGLLVDGWKLDIFVVDRAASEETRVKTEKVRQKLTDSSRRIILEVKEALLLPSGRTPKFSGKHIYEAVLEKGLSSKEEIFSYLADFGYRKAITS